MDNPPADTTIVNVKGVRVSSWERGKKDAEAAKATMGAWVSLALDRAHDGGVSDAGKPDYAAALARLAPVVQGMGAKLNRDAAASVSRLVDAYAREAAGLPARKVRALPAPAIP
jgi:hypothetical protein